MKWSVAVSVGTWSMDSGDDPHAELIEVETEAALGCPRPACRITAYSPAGGATGPAGALASGSLPGADRGTGTTLRGQDIALSDPIAIELTAGDIRERVATAEVSEIRSTLGAVRIEGRGPLERLAAQRLTAVYENQSLGRIVRDLAERAGVTPVDVDAGATYPYVLVHESRSVLRHILDLAGRESMDVYAAPDGSLVVKGFQKTSADHALRYGAEVLAARLAAATSPERVVAYAESPSSGQGADTWDWLVKDGDPYRGEAGEGALAVAVQDGAVRSKEAADRLAASLLGRAGQRNRLGWVRILGNPGVALGDAIEISGAPRPELDGVFKVAAVRHRFGRRTGCTTEIDLTGLEGPGAAGTGAGAGELAGGLVP